MNELVMRTSNAMDSSRKSELRRNRCLAAHGVDMEWCNAHLNVKSGALSFWLRVGDACLAEVGSVSEPESDCDDEDRET